MRVLISAEHSGIVLSMKAIDRLIELTGDARSKYIFTDLDGREFVEDLDDSYRTDPLWLQVYDELGSEFSDDITDVIEIPDNSNFYIFHHDWAGENVVLQTFEFDETKIKSLLPDVDCSKILQLLKDNPKLVSPKETFIESSVDKQYNSKDL